MITTGSPLASFFATCGSDPIEEVSPLGGRHGTRLKMSLADLAACFALSIALSVRLFCGASAGTGAAEPGAAAVGAARADCARAQCSATGMRSRSAESKTVRPARRQRDNVINQKS